MLGVRVLSDGSLGLAGPVGAVAQFRPVQGLRST